MQPLPDLTTLARRLSRWPVLLAWMAVIFALSSIPNEIAPATPDPIPFDKVAHFGEYAVLGVLLAGIGLRYAGRRGAAARAAIAVAAAVAAAALYGATDEVHQRFVPGRDPSARDWTANVAGAAIGAVPAAAVLRNTPPGEMAPTRAAPPPRRRRR